jgi:hypothetical protein
VSFYSREGWRVEGKRKAVGASDRLTTGRDWREVVTT